MTTSNQKIVTPGGSSYLTAAPSTGQFVWEMSDGAILVATWLQAPEVATAGWYVARSMDNGATWVGLQLISGTIGSVLANATKAGIHLAQAGDIIIGLNYDATGAYIVKIAYVAGAFTTSLSTYTPTNAWNAFALYVGGATYDSVKGAVHVVLEASPDSGTTDYLYLIALNPTTGLKITESRFVIVDTGLGAGQTASVRVDQSATPKLFIVYVDGSTGQGIKYRSYTFSGTSYATADAEETVFAGAAAIYNVACSLNASGQMDTFWIEGANVKTNTRTGVATYGGVTTLGTDATPGIGNRGFALAEHANANADRVVFWHHSGTGVKYRKRIASVWQSTVTLHVSMGSNDFLADMAVVRIIPADGTVHMRGVTSSYGVVPYYVVYESIGQAQAPTLSNLRPAKGANVAADVVNLVAKYEEALANDVLGKYIASIWRASDVVLMWSSGTIAKPGAPTLADGGAGAMGAGTYRYAITFVTETHPYFGTDTGETDYGTEASITIGAARRVNLTAIPLGPTGTIKRRIWRTAAGGGAGTENLLATLNDNTTTTYNDNAPDPLAANSVPTVNWSGVFTTWGGAPVNPGSDFSVAHAATLTKNTEYVMKMQAVESAELRSSIMFSQDFSFSDPPLGARPWTATDTTRARTRVGVALAQPRATELFPSVCAVRRRLASAAAADAWTTLLSSKAITRPTEAGLTYAQLPTKGLARNLVTDGAPFAAETLDANASVVEDAAAPSGRAIRAYGTGYTTAKICRAEATRNYSVAASIKGDGTNNGEALVEWLDASFAVLSTWVTLTRSVASYADASNANVTAPANTKYVRIRVRSASASGIAYFSAFRVKEAATVAAWSNADQQLLGDTGVVIDANTDKATFAFPTDVDPESFNITVAYRPAAVPHAAYAHLVTFDRDTNNYITLYSDITTARISLKVQKGGATFSSPIMASGAIAAGDTLGISAGKDSSGVAGDVYTNGAGLVSFSDPGEKAKWHGIVPTSLIIGQFRGDTQHADGIIGIVRLQKAMSQARRQAFALDPYMAPQPEDLHIYAVTGSGVYEVPIHDDEIAGPGITYDYAVDTTAATPPTTVASGSAFEQGYAATADMLWLKCPADPDLNLKLRQKYDTKWPNERGRGVQLLEPVEGGAPLAVYNAKPGGRTFDIDAIWPESAANLSDVAAAIAALDGLQETDEDVYLLDHKGHSVKVVFAEPIRRRDHPEGYLEVQTRLVEAQ